MLIPRFYLIGVFIPLVLLSCKKEESNSQGNRLRGIRVKEKDSLFYRSFKYDNQNRLITILDSNNNGGKHTFSIVYNSQGKISSVTEAGNVYTFEFDDKGRIIKKLATHIWQQTPLIENTYSYDGNGRVTADSLYGYWTKDVYSVTSYSYDQNNNVIESRSIDKVSGTVLSLQQYSYDNHPNPLEGLNIFTYLLATGYEIPSGKNNLVQSIYQGGTIVNYTYEYYSNGSPKKCSFQDNSDPLVTYVDYYYE